MNISDFYYQLKQTEGAPWLIFLHGLLGSHANWRRITPAFEGKYNILTLDQRGHGKSFKPKSGYAPEDFASDLLFIMDELKIKSAHLVGHSMGGRNSLCFAARHPERVEKLVIEDIGPESSVANGSGLFNEIKNVPVPFAKKVLAKEYLMTEFPDPKLGSFLYTSIVENAEGKAVWSFDLKMLKDILISGRSKSRWDEVKKLQCPTLVIRGSLSQELSVDEWKQMQAVNQKVRGAQVEGSGHWVHFDQPDKFIDLLKNFFDAGP